MPLKRGKSKRTFEDNLHELHHGRTYARTRRRHGKRKADKQAIAIAFKERRMTRY